MKILKYFLVLVIPISLFAKVGSVYTRYGLGDVYHTYSARKFSMGELGSALMDQNNLSEYNPASWFNIKLTRFELGLDYNGYDISSTEKNNYYSFYEFNGFMVGFPISKENGIAVVGGIVPVTNVNYQVIENIKGSVTSDYTSEYNGNGGLSKLFFGSSYEFPFGAVVGGAFEYYTGRIEYITDVRFTDSSSISNSNFNNTTKYRGMGFNAGVLSNNLAKSFGIDWLDDLRIGATLNVVAKLNTDTIVTTTTTVGSQEVEKATVETKVPLKFGIGLSLKVWNNYLFLLDYLYQPWTKFRFNGRLDNNLQDLTKISAGFEFRRQITQFSSFWEQFSVRGGLSYEQTQYKINGQGINFYSVYTGFSIPLSLGNSLDFGFQYGIRGTTDFNLLKENIFKAKVTLSLGEAWFIREER